MKRSYLWDVASVVPYGFIPDVVAFVVGNDPY